MDKAERKAWFRFLEQATDQELARAKRSLKAQLDSCDYEEIIWDIKVKLRTLHEEVHARAELARLRKRYSAP